ncbi:T-complex protein 11-domain-containing protein [Chlamydoabsidia padenii]|nr:T-complex protein 11-domain-containing protein [Chlamydoabsidia padenii]
MNQDDDEEENPLLLSSSSKQLTIENNKHHYHHHHHRRHSSSTTSSTSLAFLLHSFHHLGLPIIGQQDTWLGFHVLSRLIRQQDVISITGKVLNLALDHHQENGKRRNSSNKPRVFLSAYIMIMCPHDILQSPESPDEIILLESAKDLLQKFETWLDHPQRWQKRMAFVDSWCTFHSLFDQWKSKDCDQLISSMIGYYLELMSVQHVIHPNTTTNDDDDDDGESQEVSDLLSRQMEQLKVRIGKLGGDYALQSLENQMVSVSHQLQQSKGKEKKKQQQQQQSSEQVQTDAPSMDEMNRLMNDLPNTPLLTNDQLAHELILNPDFQLQADHHQRSSTNDNNLEIRVRSMATRAYFDRVNEDIQQGQYQTTLLPLLEDIRKKLLSMVEKDKPAYQMIDQVMDMALVQQQMNHETFDLSRMIDTILTCQRRLCAPSRDATLDQIAARVNEPGYQLEHIMGLLDNMHLDLANFRLRSLQPYLAQIAVEYEQQQFCTKYSLSSPSKEPVVKYRLPQTYRWIAQALEKWQRVASERNPNRLFYDALLSLIITTDNLQDNNNDIACPETLKMDHHRLLDYHDLVQQIITVASLVMVARNVGKINSASSLFNLSQTLFTLLSPQQFDQHQHQHITAELLRVTTTKTHVDDLMASMVQRILSHNDTVYALLARRVASVLKHQLMGHEFVSDAILTSSSLEYVKVPLQQLALRIDTLCHHHLKVHLPWYSKCLSHLQQ